MATGKDVLETATTILMAVAAVTIITLEVRERFVPTPTRMTLIDSWQDLSSEGRWTGPIDADVVITTFMDAQCPFCKALIPRLDSLMTMYPERVATVFHHYPLPNHQLALPAAVASECSAEQGMFWRFSTLIYAKQDSLGVKPWTSYAVDAGVADVEAFEHCMSRPADAFAGISRGISIGNANGVSGTPTIWVNGAVTAGPSLVATVSSMLEGRRR